MMVAGPELPSPSDWGWKRKDTGGWEVKWTTLPEASQARHAMNSSSVGVQHAREDANVPRHHFSVRHFATVFS